MATIRTLINEMIGRVSRGAVGFSVQSGTPTVDYTRVSYQWWDELFRGKKPDYALGALFAQPIINIISSWTLGRGVRAKLDVGFETTEQAVNEFIDTELLTFIRTYKDSLRLGDSYIAVNPDGTLVRYSPEQVTQIADPPGSQNIIAYRVTTTLPDSTVEDMFTIDGRSRTTTKAGVKTVEDFPNLIEMIPIIHWPNDPSANEIYGHPYYEQLLTLFSRYNKTMNKSLDGVDTMGNPVPVITGADDPDDVLAKIATGTRQYTGSDGVTRTVPVVDLSQVPLLVLGQGNDFNFRSPPSFTQDSGRMLEYLFLLMLQTTQIPEWTWGGAIASSKASVDAQMPAFDTFIQGMRMACSPVLCKIIKVWVAYRSLYDHTVVPVEKIPLKYGKVLIEDRAQTLESVKFARQDGEITRETALEKLELVDDSDMEVKAAQDQLGGDQLFGDQAGVLPGATKQEDASLADLAYPEPMAA